MSLQKKTEQSKTEYQQTLVIPNPTYIAYFDGACGPTNPGGRVAYGAVILREGQPIWECSELFHPQQCKEEQTTNNVAEYCGLIAVLEYLRHIGAQHEPIMIYGDSRLVIYQMFGTWNIKDGCYVPYALKAKALCQSFSNLSGQWIEREQNMVADALSKAPLQKVCVSRD